MTLRGIRISGEEGSEGSRSGYYQQSEHVATNNSSSSSARSGRLCTKGVSVHYLTNTFLAEVLAFHDNGNDDDNDNNDNGIPEKVPLTRNSTIYELEDLSSSGSMGFIRSKGRGVVCPRDGQLHAAYVDCLADGDDDSVGEATHMLSYSWGYSIGDIVDTLVDYCRSNHLDETRTYIWMCCLCMNQHRVVLAAGKEEEDRNPSDPTSTGSSSEVRPPKVNFLDEFGARVAKIGNVLAMMTPWNAPIYLGRSWCVYELYKAYCLNCNISIVMPPHQKEALIEDLLGDKGSGVNGLYHALSKTRIHKAQSHVRSDRDTILNMVREYPGDIVLNQTVNDLLRRWVRDTVQEVLEASLNKTTRDKDAGLYNRLSDLFRRNGELDLAQALAKRALVALEGNPAAHTDPIQIGIADSHNNLGRALTEKAEYRLAIVEHRKAEAILASYRGARDTNIGSTHFYTGMALHSAGDYDAAMEEFKKALAIRKTMLGEAHEDTASTFMNIGSVLQSKGDYDLALDHYQRAQSILSEVLGDHPETAAAHMSIGAMHNLNCDYDDAVREYTHAIHVLESVLGSDHIDTANAYSELSRVLYYQGRYEEALKHQEAALAIQEYVLGRQHPVVAGTYNTLGSVWQEVGNIEEALEYFRKALAIQVASLGSTHADTAPTRNNIALVYYNGGQYAEALREYRKSLALKESIVGKGHPTTSRELNRIGNCLRGLGDTKGALMEYHKALDVVGVNHAFADMIQDNISTVQQEN